MTACRSDARAGESPLPSRRVGTIYPESEPKDFRRMGTESPDRDLVHHRVRDVGDGVQISPEDVRLRIQPADFFCGTSAVDLLDVRSNGANDVK